MKLFVTLHTGYCGSDAHEVVEFRDEDTQDYIMDVVWDMAVENAAMYGYELCFDDCEDEDCDMEHPGSTNISGHAVAYVPEKHNRYLT